MASKKKSKGYEPECLREAHAYQAKNPPKRVVKHHSELGPDDEIECEVCFVAIMNRGGALL